MKRNYDFSKARRGPVIRTQCGKTRITIRIDDDGDELAEILDVEPGPELGRLLATIREAQAAGEVHTRTQAIALARDLRDGSVRPMTSGDEEFPSPEN